MISRRIDPHGRWRKIKRIGRITAEQIFLSGRIGAPRGLPGLPDEFAQPEYSTCVGLLLYGARARASSCGAANFDDGKVESNVCGAVEVFSKK